MKTIVVQPHSGRHSITWLSFAASVIAAWSFGAFGWMYGWHFQGEIALLVLTLAVGVLALRNARWNRFSFALVGIGLLVANWGLLQMTAAMTLWSINGFAP